MILSTNALVLPDSSALRRAMPREPINRQSGYEEAYDSRTLFYDAFRHDDEIILSGPPLFNLHDALGDAGLVSDGSVLSASLTDINRAQRSVLRGAFGEHVHVTLDDLHAKVQISPDGRELFRDRRALVTISRNNRLEWIADWVRYYAAMHEIDAVLIYDNGSDIYTLADLDTALSAIPGIKASIVIDWPFPFGPGAGPDRVWDSDFCQCAMLEHARFRFLEQASQVINADIDELVVTADERPLHAHLAESPNGGLTYRGRWIEGVAGTQLARFVDFDHYDSASAPCAIKWTIRPYEVRSTAQWGIHGFVGWWPTPSTTVYYGHFRHISTNWKYDRSKVRNIGDLVPDADLRRALDHAFG